MEPINFSDDVCFVIKTKQEAKIVFAFIDANNQQATYGLDRNDQVHAILEEDNVAFCLTANLSGYELVTAEMYNVHYRNVPTFEIAKSYTVNAELATWVALGLNPFTKVTVFQD